MSRMLSMILGCAMIVLCGSTSYQAHTLQAVGPCSTRSHAARLQLPSTSVFPSISKRAFLDEYCVTCHNDRRKTAGLTLEQVDLESIGENAPVWEKVVRKLRTETMPPAGTPRPQKAGYSEFASWLESALDRAGALAPIPGRPAVHRLNRAEYANAIRDLLALEIDGRLLLPGDDSGYGFDNIAAVLSVSPALLERYVLAAQKLARLAVGDPAMSPAFETYNVSNYVSQDDRMNEDLPFGSRGGIAIRHYFPIDGEYIFKISMKRDYNSAIIGLGSTNQIEVRLDGARIRAFTVGGKFPVPELDATGRPAKKIEGLNEYELTADQGLEVRVPVRAGTRVVAVGFVKRTAALREGMGPSRVPVRSSSGLDKHTLNPAIGAVRIDGPYDSNGVGDTPSRRQIFVCRPASTRDEEPCARRILSIVARRAYRRPVTQEDIEALLSFYRTGRTEKGFEAGVQLALQAILVDPDFLFRVERESASVSPAYRISDLDLASRLSFFLWSSIPDDQLLDLAERGKLKDPVVLEQQVRRMIRDSRSTALISNFVGQWLLLRNMQLVAPDPRVFPDFDDTLREAFQRETELFFEKQFREDRSVVEVLNADYTFVNERLARFYQIPNVYGSHFRRVNLMDGRRGGLLTQGSILTVTSYADRTSPTRRGKWILENILGAPPPAPPPNVSDLPDPAQGENPRSMRERMEQHRTNPVCASCHKQMDPLGFALESFDAIGGEQAIHDGNNSIDTSGALPDGTKFDGPAGLRDVLLDRRDLFITTVTEKLLTYAIGRGIEYYDAPAVREIKRQAAVDHYSWSSLILCVVKSVPFQMRASR